MEGIDGIELCNIIRNIVSCPIIFISAKSLEEDKISAFSAGGDDYIKKPFSLKELLTRIESHIRREERIRCNKTCLFSSKNVSINILSKEVFCMGTKLKLTKKEYELIKTLMMNKNTVLSKEKIFDSIWGIDSESYLETVTETIKNIRKKIKLLDSDNRYITTLYGLGYRWEITDEKK